MNIRNRVIISLIIILVFVVVLSLGIILYIKLGDINKLNQLYNDVSNDSIVLEENSYDEQETRNVIEFLRTGTGIVYFEFNKCDWCKRSKPVFKAALKEIDFEVGNVIYYNPHYIRENNTDEYKEILTILDSILDEDENGNKKLFVPEVVFLINGKIVGHKTNNVESYTNPEIEMTEEQVEELKKIYKTFMYRLEEPKGCNNCN